MFWALTEVFGWMWLARDQVDSAISGAITKNEAYKEAQQRKFRFWKSKTSIASTLRLARFFVLFLEFIK